MYSNGCVFRNTDCLASHSFKEAELLDNLCMGGRASDTQLGAGFIEKQCQMSYPHIPNTIPCAGYVSIKYDTIITHN